MSCTVKKLVVSILLVGKEINEKNQQLEQERLKMLYQFPEKKIWRLENKKDSKCCINFHENCRF